MKAIEEWRAVIGYPQYEVSDFGRVRRRETRRVLKPCHLPNRYPVVNFGLGAGASKSQNVHRLVAEAFHGPANGREVNHLNGIKADNRAVNLEWCTHADNFKHAMEAGFLTNRKCHICSKPGHTRRTCTQRAAVVPFLSAAGGAS